ncbi:hypothetical protein WJT86_01135 [Microvirga sp. W0021]|uniref:Uncharacterized protein n=1 Tax=Hohaiivirga grylli TaxID=3133970 RepID=A0ABV0BHQ5_9HYPH
MNTVSSTKRFKIMLAVGILLLGFGALTYDYTPSADSSLEAACRAKLSQQGGGLASMAERCKEQAFATAFTAQDARSAASRIGSTNQFEVIIHMVSMFALGLGAVWAIFGALGCFGLIKPRQKK